MKNRGNGMLKWLKTMVLALLLSMVIDHYFFGFAVVQGGSMEPTIFGSDRLLIGKLDYLKEPVQIGDIIIFHPPASRTSMFVKRVVAKEGDHFVMKEGVFYLNGQPMNEVYLGEQLAIERDYALTEGIVPEGMVFVLGDNRNDSNDSRSFGYISENEIRGKVLFKVWPLEEAKAFIGDSR